MSGINTGEIARFAGSALKSLGSGARTLSSGYVESAVRTAVQNELKNSHFSFNEAQQQEIINMAGNAAKHVAGQFLSGKIVGNSEGNALIDRFIRALKAAPAFRNMPDGNVEKSMQWLKENLPLGPVGNGKTLRASPEVGNGIKAMAQIMNSTLNTNIPLDNPIDIIARDVSVAFTALNAQYVADFIGIYASLNYNVDRISVLASVLRVVREELEKTDGTQREKLETIKQMLTVIDGEVQTRISMLRNTLHSDAVNNTITNMMNSRSIDLIGQITQLQNTSPSYVAKEVLNNIIRVNGTFEIVSKLESWYKSQNDSLKQIIDLFLNTGNTEEIRKIVTDMLQKPNVDTTVVMLPDGSSVSFQKAVEEILMWSSTGPDASERKKISVAVRGSAEVAIGDRVKQQLERAKMTRKAIVRQTSTLVSRHLTEIMAVIRAINAGLQDGSVRVTPQMRNMQIALHGLREIAKAGVYNAIIGVYNSLDFESSKSSFLDNLQLIQRTADAIGGPLFQQLSTKIKALYSYIDEVSELNAKQYDSTVYGVVGRGEDVFTPQLSTVLKNLDVIMHEMSYALNFHAGMKRIKNAGQQLDKVSDQFNKVRSEAVGERLNEINDVKNELIEKIKSNGAYEGLFKFDWATDNMTQVNAERNFAVEMMEDFYRVQVKLYQTAEAVDMMLEQFMKILANDVTLVKELYREIQMSGGIANWFNETSGNHLAEWFEMFPVGIDENGVPVVKTDFAIDRNTHYYEMLMKDFTHKSLSGADQGRHGLFGEGLGNHMLPLPPSKYETIKAKGLLVFQSTGALKNLFSTFINIAKQMGNNKVESFMSPSVMYKNIIEYLAVAALCRGFTVNGRNEHPFAADGVTPDMQNGPYNQAKIDVNRGDIILGRTDLAGASQSPFVKNGDNLSEIHAGPAHPGNNNTPAINARVMALRMFGIYGATVYDKCTSTLNETDSVFVMILQSMYSKIMTAIETYTMIHRPISTDRFTTVRAIIGGNSDMPDARAEYAQLYLTMILLAEYYKDLFDFDHTGRHDFGRVGDMSSGVVEIGGVNKFISVIPEGSSQFSNFVNLVFQKFSDVREGAYGDHQVRELIHSINNIIDKFSGTADDRTSTIIDQFVTEINNRYCIMSETDVTQYKDMINALKPDMTRFDDSLADGAAMDDMAILPGESDLLDLNGTAPSNVYMKSSGYAPNSIEFYKRKVNDGYRKLLNRFRAESEKYIDGMENMDHSEMETITSLIKDIDYKMRTAKDPFARYVELSKVLSSAQSDSPVDIVNTVMLQDVLAGIDMLRAVAAHMLRAASLAHLISGPMRIADSFLEPLNHGAVTSWQSFFAHIFDTNHPAAKYISVKGCRDPAILAVIANLIFVPRTSDTVINTFVPAQGQWIDNMAIFTGSGRQQSARGGTCKVLGLGFDAATIKDIFTNAIARDGDERKLVTAFIQAIVDYDLMYADIINICVDLDQFNVEKGSTGRLVDVAVNGDTIAISYGNLQEHVLHFCGDVKKIIELMRPHLSTEVMKDLTSKNGLGISALMYVFSNVIFYSRNKNLAIELSDYSFAKVADNLTAGLRYMLADNRIMSLTTDCNEFRRSDLTYAPDQFGTIAAVGENRRMIWEDLTSRYGPIPLPVLHQSAQKPVANIEFVFRSLVYFNSLIPNGGVVENVKELRSEIPIFNTVAPVLEKMTPGMFWRYELGFPSVLKTTPAAESHTLSSLMFSFNALMCSYMSEMMDTVNGKIYQKTIAPFIGSDVLARLTKSYPDTFPNMRAIKSYLSGIASADERMTVVRQLLDGNSDMLRNDNRQARNPGGVGGTDVATSVKYFVDPFINFADTGADVYTTTGTGNASSYGVSLEQMIIATQFFSSAAESYPPNDNSVPNGAITGIVRLHGSRQDDNATYPGATARLLEMSMTFVTGFGTSADAETRVLNGISTRSHKFVQNLFRYIPDKVRYRAPRLSNFVFWGHRRDPIPDQPFLSSVAYLLHAIATTKPEVATLDAGLKHMYASLADVPSYCRDIMKFKLPYYVMQFDALVRRCEFVREFLKPHQRIESSLKASNFSDFDICDPTGKRTTVWEGTKFTPNALTLIDSIIVNAKIASQAAAEAALDLNDSLKYMDMFPDRGEQQFAPLCLSLILTRYDDINGVEMNMTDAANVNSMKLFAGLRCMLSKNAPEPDFKVYAYFENIVKRYNDGAQEGFKIPDQLALEFLKSFVKMFRYIVGGRLMKRSWTNQSRFADDIKISVADVTFGSDALYSPNFIYSNQGGDGSYGNNALDTGRGTVDYDQDDLAVIFKEAELGDSGNAANNPPTDNLETIVGRARSIERLMNSLVVYSQVTRVRGISRAHDLLQAHTSRGQQRFIYTPDVSPFSFVGMAANADQSREAKYKTTATYPTHRFAGRDMLHEMSRFYYIAPEYKTGESLWSPAKSTIMGYRIDKNDNLVPFSPSHYRADVIARQLVDAGIKFITIDEITDANTSSFMNMYSTEVSDDKRSYYGEPRVGTLYRRKFFELSRLVSLLGTSTHDEVVRAFCILVNKRTTNSLERSRLRKLMINFMNVIPINPNLLGREIPLANLYNGAYNFRRFMRNRLFPQNNIGVSIVDDCSELTNVANEDEFLYKFLVNPYGKIDSVTYASTVGALMRGNGGFDLGRPQYLSDQLFSKALLGSLYESDTKQTRGGPQKTTRRPGTENSWKAKVFADSIVGALTPLLVQNEQLWKERDEMLRAICNDHGNLWRFGHLHNTQVGATGIEDNGITTARVFDAIWGDSITPYVAFSKREGDLSGVWTHDRMDEARTVGQYQKYLAKYAVLTQLLTLGRTDLDLNNPLNLVAQAVNNPTGIEAQFHHMQRAFMAVPTDFKMSNFTPNLAAFGNEMNVMRGPHTQPLNQRLSLMKVGLSRFNGINDQNAAFNLAMSFPVNTNVLTEQQTISGTTHTINATNTHFYTALDYYYEHLIPGGNGDIDLMNFWRADIDSMKLGRFSYLLSSGMVFDPNARVVGNMNIFPSIGLPTLDDVPTGQGCGPLYAYTNIPNSRSGAGYEVRAVLSPLFESYIQNMHTTSGASAKAHAEAVFASISSDMRDKRGIHRAYLKTVGSRFINGEYNDITERLPAVNVGYYREPVFTLFGNSDGRFGHAATAGHKIREIYNGRTVPVYTNAYRVAVNSDDTFSYDVQQSINNNTAPFDRSMADHIRQLDSRQLFPFFGALVFAYALLDSMIPNKNRVDQIITTALFTNTSDMLTAYKWTNGERDKQKIIQLTSEFFNNLIASIGANRAGFRPFDATFYDVPQLHNIGISYGSELAPMLLSCAHYDRLMAAYKNPAICIPVQAGDVALCEQTDIDTYAADLRAQSTNVARLLASLLSHNNNDTLSSWLDHLDRVFPDIFGNTKDDSRNGNDRNKWNFTYTRGDPTEPLNICGFLTKPEESARNKSISILNSHARLALIVAYNQIEGRKFGGVPTMSDMQSILSGVRGKLAKIPATPFFNATYFRSVGKPMETYDAVQNPPNKFISEIYRQKQILFESAVFGRSCVPVKFGMAAFYPELDSLGMKSKPANTSYFRDFSSSDRASYTGIGEIFLTLNSIHSANYNAHVKLNNAATGYGQLEHLFYMTENAGQSSFSSARNVAYDTVALSVNLTRSPFSLFNAACQTEFIGNGASTVLNIDGTTGAFDINSVVTARDSLKMIVGNRAIASYDVMRKMAESQTTCLVDDDLWKNIGLHPAMRMAIPISVLEQGAPIVYCDAIDKYTPRLRISDKTPMWSPFDNESLNILRMTPTSVSNIVDQNDTFVPWAGFRHGGEHFLNAVDRIYNNASMQNIGIYWPEIKHAYETGVGLRPGASFPSTADPVALTAITNGGEFRVMRDSGSVVQPTSDKYRASSGAPAIYNKYIVSLPTPQDCVAIFDAQSDTVNFSSVLGHSILSAEVIKQSWWRQHTYMYQSARDVPYAGDRNAHQAAVDAASADARTKIRFAYDSIIRVDSDINYQNDIYNNDVVTHTSYNFEKPQIFSYLTGGKYIEIADMSRQTDVTTKIGKFRFDTVIVRNLMMIHLLHVIMSKDVLTRLTDLGKDPLYGKVTFNAALKDYNRDDAYEDREKTRTQDRDGWSAIPL